jgi:putative transcriptional regulator
MSEANHEPHGVSVHLDYVLAKRGMTLTELADRVGVTVVNLSVLKNGRARAVRFPHSRRSAGSSTASQETC